MPSSELEREVSLDQGRPVAVHEPCYQIWRVETLARVAAQGRSGLAPS